MKRFACAVLTLLSGAAFALDTDYVESVDTVNRSSVSYEAADGSFSASLKIMRAQVNLSTTKEYAQYVMDSYQGWGLKPVVDLRGFSFNYIDNGPCSFLVTYFDGRSYLGFSACGKISADDLTRLFKIANETLKLDEILKQQSHATTY